MLVLHVEGTRVNGDARQISTASAFLDLSIHMPEELRQSDPAHGGKVAVLWLFRSRLVMEPTDLDKAELWGQYLNAPGHDEVWTHLQRDGQVPLDVEYDTPPRGRVVFDSLGQRFHLYADGCILAQADLVSEILRRLNLPTNTDVHGDEHYRCAFCLRRRKITWRGKWNVFADATLRPPLTNAK